MKKIKLSILDQSIVRNGSTASEALQETIATAKMAEQLGFHRFWVSEHHNSSFIAGSAPELLLVKLGDETKHIRIGSGGIMLPNHSALKVAENFRMLENFFPGRIDLGMGRAPGGDRITAVLLNPSNDFSEEAYLRQLEYLQHFFSDSAGTKHGPIIAIPQTPNIPAQWILSSSGGSSRIAAKFGAGLAIARFINGHATPDIVTEYRRHFQSSAQLDKPHEFLAITVLCADTEEKAKEMRKFMDYILVQFEKGNFDKFIDYEEVKKYEFTPNELERVYNNRGRAISGTKEQVKEQIIQLANEFDVDEVMVSAMTGNAADRKRSFELLAEAFELGS